MPAKNKKSSKMCKSDIKLKIIGQAVHEHFTFRKQMGIIEMAKINENPD